jgi:mercuric ion binding protein
MEDVVKRKYLSDLLINILIVFCFSGPVKAEIERATLRVDGLACPFCAYGLEKKLKDIKSITTYDIDMKEGKVFLGVKPDVQIEIDSFNKTVKEAGFTLRSVSLRVRGKVYQTEEGLILLAAGSDKKFFLFEDEALLWKFHQGEDFKAFSEDLKKKLLDIKEQGKEVLIEGIFHEHKDYPPGLSVDHLELIEQVKLFE